eukprot:GHVU01083138.1.p1 GENE.GHVU01083138.1~~GHVU01083138.1.p1  ORF type:complete len:141 (+),score=8.76 GHVU01083138.1:668-1090(+)
METDPPLYRSLAVCLIADQRFCRLTLYLFSEFWGLCLNPGLQQWNIAKGMQKLFPFKRTFDVNLTHILLFALIICLLSLRWVSGWVGGHSLCRVFLKLETFCLYLNRFDTDFPLSPPDPILKRNLARICNRNRRRKRKMV